VKDPNYILNQIADFNGKLNNEVVILTYGIGDGELLAEFNYIR